MCFSYKIHERKRYRELSNKIYTVEFVIIPRIYIMELWLILWNTVEYIILATLSNVRAVLPMPDLAPKKKIPMICRGNTWMGRIVYSDDTDNSIVVMPRNEWSYTIHSSWPPSWLESVFFIIKFFNTIFDCVMSKI